MSLSSTARFFLGAALVSVAFVFPPLFFPFSTSKVVVFRLFVELAALFFLFDVARSPKDRYGSAAESMRRSPIVWAITAFVLVFLLAGAFGINPHVSWWSDFERGEGGWMMVHFYLFFILLLFLADTEARWLRFFKVALAAALASVGYVAAIWLDPHGLAPFVAGDGRFGGSFGNPTYLAGYLLFAFFYLGYLWACSRAQAQAGACARARTALFVVLFLVFAASLFATGTRGAFAGFGAGVAAFLLCAIFSQAGAVRRWAVAALAAAVIAGGGMVFFRNSRVVKQLPASRLFDIAASDQSLATRVWAWHAAWQGFLARPVLGWGPENFLAVFDRYFDTRYFLGSGVPSQTWFDRAHNVVFDYLAETGILGFLSYGSIFAAFYVMLFRSGSPLPPSPAPEKKRFSPERALLIGMPIAYLVNGMAFFDAFPVYLNLFFFFAFAAFLFHTAAPYRDNRHA